MLTQPAALIGHSLGAMQIVKVAADSPAAVACAVLEDPPLYAGERPETDFTQFRLMEGAARSGMSVEQILALWTAPPWMGQALQREYVGLTELDPENLTVTIDLEATRGFDVDAHLARVSCPTLVIRAGGEGGALPQADLDRGLSHLARGIGVVIPRSGHQVHAEQSAAFRRAVEDFLRVRAA
ncbi:MAG TPA: alpha/beta hydrolase [Myxococcota bacterium]|nr:alpha/beta hydrolase [Myxococcota bacterium]